VSDGLGDLTVLIPTWNRERYVRRQIEFWRGSEATVVIADGSPEPSEVLARDPAVRYEHLPISLSSRLRLLSEQVETRWGVLLSDDEFMLPAALRACIDRLEADRTAVACKPFPVGFEIMDGTVRWGIPYPEMAGASLGDGSAGQRVRDHLNPYRMLTLWSVTRADVLRNACGAIDDLGAVHCSGAQEILYSIVVAAAGRARVLDQVGWLRSYENQNQWGANDRLPFDRWLTAPDYAAEVRRFQEVCALRMPELQAGELRESLGLYAQSLREARTGGGHRVLRGLARIGRGLNGRLSRSGWPAWPADQVMRALGRRGITCDSSELAGVEQRLEEFSGS
jgi:glycosyltransferase domain-containing protein